MLRPFSSGWLAWTSFARSLISRGCSLQDAAWNRSLETAGLKACTKMIWKDAGRFTPTHWTRGSHSLCNTACADTMASIDGYQSRACHGMTNTEHLAGTLVRVST